MMVQSFDELYQPTDKHTDEQTHTHTFKPVE